MLQYKKKKENQMKQNLSFPVMGWQGKSLLPLPYLFHFLHDFP